MRVIEGVAWLCALTLAATAPANEWLGFLLRRLLWGIWQVALLPAAYALTTIGIRRGRSFTATPGPATLPSHTYND